MHFLKSRSRVVAAAAIVVLLAVGSWLVFKPKHQSLTPQNPQPVGVQAGQTTTGQRGADPTKLVTIETADFSYAKPAGWAEISPKALNGANSGIGRPTVPVATFTIKVSSVVPKDDAEVKDSVLSAPKYLPNFGLISSESTKVNGQPGQKFIYSYTDSKGSNKITSNMSVVVYKQRSFFLLFSSGADDYDKQVGDFDKILASFKFK